MEWLVQNWIYVAIIAGMIVLIWVNFRKKAARVELIAAKMDELAVLQEMIGERKVKVEAKYDEEDGFLGYDLVVEFRRDLPVAMVTALNKSEAAKKISNAAADGRVIYKYVGEKCELVAVGAQETAKEVMGGAEVKRSLDEVMSLAEGRGLEKVWWNSKMMGLRSRRLEQLDEKLLRAVLGAIKVMGG